MDHDYPKVQRNVLEEFSSTLNAENIPAVSHMRSRNLVALVGEKATTANSSETATPSIRRELVTSRNGKQRYKYYCSLPNCDTERKKNGLCQKHFSEIAGSNEL